MTDTLVRGMVPLPIESAFDIYVNQMDTWWPRHGVFPYSFTPRSTMPHHIRFEAKPGGRYYETFADGSEYVIGYIQMWKPPEQLEYTWRDPTWRGETLITVSFNQMGQETEVVCEQDGFAEVGVPELIAYYQIGNRQTLAGFFAHCLAIYELGELESGKK